MHNFLKVTSSSLLLTVSAISITSFAQTTEPTEQDYENNSTAPIVSGDCADTNCAENGVFTQPFVEPVVYRPDGVRQSNEVPINNPLRQITRDERCTFDEEGRPINCKPSGTSVAQLYDGRILYYNALEGTENVEFSVFLEVGQVVVDDQTRVLELDENEAKFSIPSPVTAGAEEPATELFPGLTAGDDGIKNDGALFCSDLKHLADGRVMAVGGTNYYSEPGIPGTGFGLPELEGLDSARIFNPRTNDWTQTGSMTYGRWYPSLTTLPNGDMFVSSGVTKLLKPVYPDNLAQSGRNVTRTETYDLSCGVWEDNGGTAERSLPLYPRQHLLPNGQVYYNGVGQAFNPFGQAYDQALWNIVGAYDPEAGKWTDLGYAGLPLRFNDYALDEVTGALNITNPFLARTVKRTLLGATGSIVEDPLDLLGPVARLLGNPTDLRSKVETALGAGFRGSTHSIMLPLKPNEATGKYEKAEFLTAGGVMGLGVATSPGSYLPTNLSRIDTVNVDGFEMEYESRLTGKLNQPRWYGTAVLLPNSEVIVFSGANRDEVVAPGSGQAIRQAELFNPETETWRPIASATQERTYHNTAMLLQDGRVLIGGHSPINTAYLYTINLPGFSPNDGRDPSFEIYSPPYMFKDRPEIKNVKRNISHGESVNVSIDAAEGEIDSVVLVRNTSMTHVIDGDQRTVHIPISSQSNNKLKIEIPENKAVVPPGPYIMFVNKKDSDGSIVPSPGYQVMVDGASFQCDAG